MPRLDRRFPNGTGLRQPSTEDTKLVTPSPLHAQFIESSRETLLERYLQTRARSVALCQPLSFEDHCIQTMADVSPPKWHLAHTTWFFETFLLKALDPQYRVFHPRFDQLFNSYYETLGRPYPRPQRGLLSRPGVAEVRRYRAHVDEAMTALFQQLGEEHWNTFSSRVILGLHHEQQHQELLLTDTKHILAFNPLRPAYRDDLPTRPVREAPPLSWIESPAGVGQIGFAGDAFAFDNETPRHRIYVHAHRLASRPVTNGEYLAFIDDKGYRRPELWLSEGWSTLKEICWEAPLYWERIENRWWHYTLGGMQPVNPHEPVCHVSLYEADAYARWAGKRLPTEAELELAAADRSPRGRFYDSLWLQPAVAPASDDPAQIYGDVWEWTQSAYAPYPGFHPLDGSLGEYNGKFMCGQMVLRGGSCVTPEGHLRPSYRNFFYPKDRWQFSGIRLAENA